VENPKITAWLDLAKKHLKNYLILGLLAMAGLLLFGYMQLGWFSTPNYLVSVTAEDGASIGPADEDGCFALTLKGADHVLWFTDRPERDAFSTGISPLLDVWQEEFGNNPPNANLQLFNEDGEGVSMILVLESAPTFGAYTHTVTFDKACPLFSSGVNSDLTTENISGKNFSKAVLFIDDFLTAGLHSLGQAIVGSIKHETHHSTTALAKGVNFGNWEGHAAGYATGVVTMAAEVGGDAGEDKGGGEGRQIGSRVGAELGIVVVKTTASIAFGADVDGSSVVDPHDFAEALKEALSAAAVNLNFAYAITDNILSAQEDTIRANFFDSLEALSVESGKERFCGEPITEDNSLFKVFMYYLQLKLEARIYYDLEGGMSLAEVQSDVALNMHDDIRYSLLRALWELQYYCVFSEDDLYTTLFIEIYVVQYIAATELPELGVEDQYFIDALPTIPKAQAGIGYPEEDVYLKALDKYYREKYGDEWDESVSERLSVADVYTKDLEAFTKSLEEADYPIISTLGTSEPLLPPQIGPNESFGPLLELEPVSVTNLEPTAQSQAVIDFFSEQPNVIDFVDTRFPQMTTQMETSLVEEIEIEFDAVVMSRLPLNTIMEDRTYFGGEIVVDQSMVDEIVETAVEDAVLETATDAAIE